MDTCVKSLEDKLYLKTEIKQEYDVPLSISPETVQIKDEPIDLNKVESEPDNLDVESEMNYFVIDRELQSINDIKTGGCRMKSDGEYDADHELKRKRKENMKEGENSRYSETFWHCDKLKKHVTDHEDERLFKCKLCNGTFNEGHNLLENIKTHAGNGQIQAHVCENCAGGFSHSISLKSQVVTQDEAMENLSGIKCEDVEIKFEENDSDTVFENLKEERVDTTGEYQSEHVKTIKSRRNWRKPKGKHVSYEKQMYTCDSCDYETDIKRNLTRHQLRHVVIPEEKMYKCDSCNYKTGFKSTFTQHQLTHKNNLNTKTYECDLCNYKTINKSNFGRHQRTHAPKEQMIKCDSCDYKTGVKENFIRHQLKHQNTPNKQMYKCDLCGFKTGSRNSFVRHLLTHSDIPEEKMYKCDLCDYKAIYKSYLTLHRQRHEDTSGGQMYQCNICDYKTPRRRYLTRHQRRHNITEDKMHKCESCGYKTVSKAYLKKHQLRHKDVLEVEMYKCDLCDYKTRFKSYITKHQVKHTDQMFKCDLCDYKTFYKSSCVRHQRIHKNIPKHKKYECDSCSYKTDYEPYLTEHQLRHNDISE